MKRSTLSFAAAAAAVTLVAGSAGAQTAPAPKAKAAPSAKAWTPGQKTGDGQPDIQGMWTNYTNTPFEVFDASDKPEFYGGDVDGKGGGTGPGFIADTFGRKLSKGRSLVVDPPSGRVPIMAWAEKQRVKIVLSGVREPGSRGCGLLPSAAASQMEVEKRLKS